MWFAQCGNRNSFARNRSEPLEVIQNSFRIVETVKTFDCQNVRLQKRSTVLTAFTVATVLAGESKLYQRKTKILKPITWISNWKPLANRGSGIGKSGKSKNVRPKRVGDWGD